MPQRPFQLAHLLRFIQQQAPELKAKLVHSGAGESQSLFRGVSANSKTLNEETLFFALVGSRTDAHQFMHNALEAQSPALFIQRGRYSVEGNEKAAIVEVEDTYHAYGLACAFVQGVPAQSLRCIGVTGTNGKTTVTHLIERVLTASGLKTGLIGTLGVKHGEMAEGKQYADTGHTTPMAETLQAHLYQMKEAHCEAVVMEVSSHALHQHRTATCDFEVGVLTNLTQDHLDYHITMEAYAEAKALLFKRLNPNAADARPRIAVINADDERADFFAGEVPTGVQLLRYGIASNKAEVRAERVRYAIGGSSFTAVTPNGDAELNLKLAGEFSVYNALAAIAVGVGLNVPLETIKQALEAETGVVGRFEVVHREPYVIVDYAHTPDGLENVLEAVKQVLPEGGRLITLFGCGGDRDATKRPQMAAIAERLSDALVVTSDNPRTEDPEQIIADVLTGLNNLSPERVKVIADRREAIQAALDWAAPRDIVVLAGKGHETYQILATETIHFDDKEEAQAYLSSKAPVA